MIFFESGRVPDMRMNGNCAGGTGAFIDQTATLLGVDVSELNDLAARAEHIYPIASRCGVFSKTDIQNLISRSVSKEDIAASMLNAVSMQVVSALARGTDVHPKIFLCGGPFAYIPELRKHLLRALDMTEEDCIKARNVGVSNSQLYKQAGNGVTVNVIEAIGRRIREMDAALKAGMDS